MGVSSPPALATTKMKKTKTCPLPPRAALARKSGRTSSMEAPVVPITDARSAPMASTAVFRRGVPESVPRTTIPEAMTNSAPSRMTKARYSAPAWTRAGLSRKAVQAATGTPRTRLSAALLRLCSQNRPATSGSSAMQRSMAANGATLQSGNAPPARSHCIAVP